MRKSHWQMAYIYSKFTELWRVPIFPSLIEAERKIILYQKFSETLSKGILQNILRTVLYYYRIRLYSLERNSGSSHPFKT